MAVSASHTGWLYSGADARLDTYYRGTRVSSLNATGVTAGIDDIILRLGTDSDGAMVLRTATLAADTVLTGVLVGTPVSQALAANSVMIANVTASGDIGIYVNLGGNSQEVLHADASADILRLGWGLTQVFVSVGAVDTFDVTATAVGLIDNVSLELGTDDDSVLRHRTATLAANTALTDVLAGTPASAATPANSLLVSNITADGDIAFFTVNAAGANSIEAVRIDASAGLVVVNEAAADLDFRVEGDTNANMIVMDAGTDSIAFGVAVVAGAPLAISNLTGRTLVTAVGNAIHVPAGSLTDGGGTGTIAVLATAFVGARTVLATNTITYTDAVGLRVLNPVASTGATFTNIRSIWSEGNIQIGVIDDFGTTQPTAAVVLRTGTAPSGAVVSSGAIYSDGTVMRKAIADGTNSNVET